MTGFYCTLMKVMKSILLWAIFHFLADSQIHCLRYQIFSALGESFHVFKIFQLMVD